MEWKDRSLQCFRESDALRYADNLSRNCNKAYAVYKTLTLPIQYIVKPQCWNKPPDTELIIVSICHINN